MPNPGDVEAGTSTAQVVLAAPGAGRRWYLTDLSAKSDAAAVLTVQSPASTNKLRHSLQAGEGYEKRWEKGLSGAENSAMVIDMSAGTYDINYRAEVR